MKFRILTLAVLAAAAFAGGYAANSTRPAVAADPVAGEATPRYYTLHDGKDVGGLWVSRGGTGPFASLVAQRMPGAGDVVYLGFARDHKGKGCDLAITADKDGVTFQVRNDKGEFHMIPATALLKLKDAEKAK